MPYVAAGAEFWQHIRDGYLPGIRPDHIRMIETFQPFDEAELTESAAATMVRSAMRHFANLRASSTEQDSPPLIVMWAHSAEPEVLVDPPSQVVSIESTGGVLVDSRTVATYQVTGDFGDADVRGNPNIAFDVIANQPPWPTDPDDNFSAR